MSHTVYTFHNLILPLSVKNPFHLLNEVGDILVPAQYTPSVRLSIKTRDSLHPLSFSVEVVLAVSVDN